MKNLLLFCVVVVVTFASHAQLKGNVNRLEGTWKYEGGSGYEIWKSNGNELIGFGYRSTKFQDTVLVEELKITRVNKRLSYSLKTRQQTSVGIQVIEHRFISKNNRKMIFDNLDNENPRSIQYKFGFFNKNKLRILISYDGKPKPVVLKLRRATSDYLLN